MIYLKTHMCLQAENKLIETEDIKVGCGIFQGDSLSQLLFCICFIPLTQKLNRINRGYEEHKTKTRISHLLYKDDLKLIAKSEEEPQKQIQTVKNFSDDINPLPSLTLQSARILNVACHPKRSKALLLSSS